MYLIVGANGFLGSYIIKNILEQTDQKIIAVTRNSHGLSDTDRITWLSCDISQKEETDKLADRVHNMGGRMNVIYLAAYHHPDEVEQHPQTAWHTNIVSLAYFLNAVENVRCFFYPSTDSVYGNGDAGYHFKETDPLHPVNTYGRQKALAECIVNTYGYHVVRFPFLIAPSILPHKKHFYDQIAETILHGGTIEMLADSMRSSLDFGTAAELLVKLTENFSGRMPQILNVCGDEDLSKYDIGIRIAEKLRVPKERIIPVLTDQVSGIFQTERAKSTLMDNARVKEYLGLKEIKISL